MNDFEEKVIDELLSYGCSIHEILLLRRLNYTRPESIRLQYEFDFIMYGQFEE